MKSRPGCLFVKKKKKFPCHVVLLKLKFIILQVTHWARNTEIVFEFAYWQSGTVVHCGQGLEQSMKVIFNIFFVKLQFLLLVAFLGITDEQKFSTISVKN
jgi:hypothetical protein